MTNEEFTQYMKKYGANEALFEAVAERDFKKAKIALKAGANVNTTQNDYGNTPLMLASASGCTEMVKLLIEAEAYMYIKYIYINTKNKNGDTALIGAARSGYTEIAKILIEAGANIDAKNNYGITPLMRATYEGYIEVVKLLIEVGADIDAKDGKGRTALMWAAKEERAEIVKLLIEVGADFNAKDSNKKTVLDFAKTDEMKELCRKYINSFQYRKELEKQKSAPAFQFKLSETKKRLQSNPRTKSVSGVVVADKIAEMIRSGKIMGDVTPEKGKKLRGQIAHEIMIAKAAKTTQR